MVKRIYVEKKDGFDSAKAKALGSIESTLGIKPESLRVILRYDVENLDERYFEQAKASIFSEPTIDNVFDEITSADTDGKRVFIVQYQDGQFDQRADSAAQCVQLLTGGIRPLVACATVYVVGGVDEGGFEKIKKLMINPVDSREGSFDMPSTLAREAFVAKNMRVEEAGFCEMDDEALEEYFNGFGFAMTLEDLRFVRDYFISQKREPTFTELKVIDTYWSDHCRHTTFLTEIKDIKLIKANPRIDKAIELYRKTFAELYADRPDKYPCLMDIATIAAKKLSRDGYLDNLDKSDEINACSVVVKVDNDGVDEEWLIMFKNETHNHPTEIEPFGGAATCLGGAIRDPLSGRTYVYQAMRVTGCGNPLEPYSQTMEGKLPQRVLTRTALSGFSAYGNQIGLATGTVAEIYNDNYKAKRLETGYVIGGAPRKNVVRQKPKCGDVILLIGGDTGRDGCGGATGSSKRHTLKSVETCGAEVQKGNAPEERKLQRLFRNEKAARMIIKCNDFGAGGVSVAIGELADGLDVYLDRISKKYDGLTATELAISESQERMAVMLESKDLDEFTRLCSEENLKSAHVATVTDTARLRMFYGDETIVDIQRSFLDTNGVKQEINVEIDDGGTDFFAKVDPKTAGLVSIGSFGEALKYELSKLNNCQQKGAGETFDSTIGAGTVLMPFGGKTQDTPSMIMASKPPVSGFTHTVTCSSFALYTDLMQSSPFVGAAYSIVGSVSKLVASGAHYKTIRLTLQEFFKKLGKDSLRWGEPTEALLGAFDCQMGLRLGAIGGKDSMSGSFENIDVPPTLISFAMGIAKDYGIIHNAFPNTGLVYHFSVPRDEYGMPSYDRLLKMYLEIQRLIDDKIAIAACVVEGGGVACSLARSLMGNECGVELEFADESLFRNLYGDVLLVSDCKLDARFGVCIGKLTDNGTITVKGKSGIKVNISDCVKAYKSALEGVFRTTAKAEGNAESCDFDCKKSFSAVTSVAKPRVFIPVFPGTNCEYDTARAFERAGATADIFVVRNNSAEEIQQSITEMCRRIDNSQIIAFPGGFSGGDEPDGSGKFFATAFRNPSLCEAIEKMLYARDGLALGICNGFQALIKLGLLPYGKIQPQTADSPTLTFNNIGRHVSTIVNVRVATNNSPWLAGIPIGTVYSVPVSHGEGKFIANSEHFARLKAAGQVATQYVNFDNEITMESPYNPNGSNYAIEGIISPDGRVYGKMGHAERYQKGLYQNVDGNFDMPIFANAVKYYK